MTTARPSYLSTSNGVKMPLDTGTSDGHGPSLSMTARAASSLGHQLIGIAPTSRGPHMVPDPPARRSMTHDTSDPTARIVRGHLDPRSSHVRPIRNVQADEVGMKLRG